MSGNSKNAEPKHSSSDSAEEYRRYLIRMMRTGAGDINPDDELCQSRKRITCDVHEVSAVGEGTIAFALVHQYLYRL
jgi:hypothetical protein